MAVSEALARNQAGGRIPFISSPPGPAWRQRGSSFLLSTEGPAWRAGLGIAGWRGWRGGTKEEASGRPGGNESEQGDAFALVFSPLSADAL